MSVGRAAHNRPNPENQQGKRFAAGIKLDKGAPAATFDIKEKSPFCPVI
jgi:hypothetical protein